VLYKRIGVEGKRDMRQRSCLVKCGEVQKPHLGHRLSRTYFNKQLLASNIIKILSKLLSLSRVERQEIFIHEIKLVCVS
jgi:hypothetical protein